MAVTRVGRAVGRRAVARLEELASTWRGAAACFFCALVSFGVQSLAWPLYHGRDAENYLVYYLELWSADPLYPIIMLYRTPVAPLFFGPLLDVFGGAVTEAATALLYAGSIVAFGAAAGAVGPRVAVATVAVLLVYPPYGAIFHGVATEPMYSAGLALWALVIMKTADRPSPAVFAFHGLVLFGLVLVRPPSQALLIFAFYPLLLRSFSLRRRLAWSGAFAGTAAALIVGWAGYNHVRYGDFVVARTSLGANFPLVRLFTLDHLIRPENGPATRELAAAVERDLLVREPYRSYGVTVDEFFANGNSLAWSDLIPLVDRTWGWDSDYEQLLAVSWEAIAAHPYTYLHHVAGTLRYELWEPFTLAAQRRENAPAALAAQSQGTIVVAGRRLPQPPEGQLTPESHIPWGASTPDGRITMDWTDLRNPRPRFRDPRDAARARDLGRDEARLERQLPYRDGSTAVAAALNAAARLFPPMLLWLVAGLVGIAVRRPRRSLELGVLCALALVLLVMTALGQPTAVAFRVPFDPIFILLVLAGWLGPTSRGTVPPTARD